MARTRNLALVKSLIAVAAYVATFCWGLQYAYYRIFSQFVLTDDEGTMMLRVRAFIEDPSSYDAVAGKYGPFYYLHKYATYSLLGQDVSHDVNRLTTIVLWGVIAAACAMFVHRLSRSMVLAVVVQFQLILLLTPMIREPGHPQEIALVLIAGALLLSSFVHERRGGLVAVAGLGAAAAALTLVKVNVGVYLCVPLMLALLWALPRHRLVLALALPVAAGALVLPAAILSNHLHVPWGSNYCALVTLVIGACLVAASRASRAGELQWRHASASAIAAILTAGSTCAVIVAWGSSLPAIANSVYLRAAKFPASFVMETPVNNEIVTAAAVSFLLAVGYALTFGKRPPSGIPAILLSLVKLSYGCFAFYSAMVSASSLLLQAIPLPFLWLVVVPPTTTAKPALQDWFPRMFLGLLAAFQMLQAYPIYGSQRFWAVFLVVPAAAICVADALPTIVAALGRFVQDHPWSREPSWRQPIASLLVTCCVFAGYYIGTNTAGLAAEYAKLVPVDLPGARRLRLQPRPADFLRWVADQVSSNCDGFVGMPGFPSLYFFAQLPAPGIISAGWVQGLDDDAQQVVINRMRSYRRPCVLYNAKDVKVWNLIEPSWIRMPLVRYIQSDFQPSGKTYGTYTLLKPNRPAEDRSQGTPR